MLNLKNKIEEAGEHVRDYYETTTELKKLQALDKASTAFSSATAAIAVLFILLIALFFGSVTAALIISAKSGNMYTGFLYVTGFYLFLSLLLFAFRKKWMSDPLRNMIIKSFFRNEPKN